jgi:hypothetical protein
MTALQKTDACSTKYVPKIKPAVDGVGVDAEDRQKESKDGMKLPASPVAIDAC